MHKLSLLICIMLLAASVQAEVRFEDTSALFDAPPYGISNINCVDLNNDNYPDIVANGDIWKNEGGKKFVMVSDKSGITIVNTVSLIADFNGDGKADIFYAKTGDLWLGNGDFTFKKGEAEKAPHDMGFGVCAFDLENDGKIDIYVGGYEKWDEQKSFSDFIYSNDGKKLSCKWQSPRELTYRCHGGVTACDFNEDGRMDIYVSNYRLQPNFLFINNGNGSLTEAGLEYNVAGTNRKDAPIDGDTGVYYCCGHTISSVWADFNNDCLFDLFVGNFSHPPSYQDRPMFLENNGKYGKYHFVDRSAVAKLRWQESYAGSGAGDYDNDGRIDLFFTTVYDGDAGVLLHNEGGWKFSEVAGAGGISTASTYQSAWADFDRDGRLDFFTCGRFYKNVSDAGHYLQVKLIDKTQSNTFAIGAKIILTTSDGKKQIRQIEAGTGCSTQSDFVQHFGLGENKNEVDLTVTWSDGMIKEYKNIRVDTLKEIIRK